MALFKIKKWTEFQHYKDRDPPWLKLHRKLLDDYDFQCLPIASKALAPMLWLLASENDGRVECDIPRLAFRLRWSEVDIEAGLLPLIEKGFLIQASEVLAPCLQDAPTETENRVQSKPKTNRAATPRFDPGAVDLPGCIARSAWDRWVAYRRASRKPMTEATVAGQIEKLAAWAEKGYDPAAIINESITNGWQGLFEPKAAAPPRASGRQSAIDNYAAQAAAARGDHGNGCGGNGRTFDVHAERVA